MPPSPATQRRLWAACRYEGLLERYWPGIKQEGELEGTKTCHKRDVKRNHTLASEDDNTSSMRVPPSSRESWPDELSLSARCSTAAHPALPTARKAHVSSKHRHLCTLRGHTRKLLTERLEQDVVLQGLNRHAPSQGFHSSDGAAKILMQLFEYVLQARRFALSCMGESGDNPHTAPHCQVAIVVCELHSAPGATENDRPMACPSL